MQSLVTTHNPKSPGCATFSGPRSTGSGRITCRTLAHVAGPRLVSTSASTESPTLRGLLPQQPPQASTPQKQPQGLQAWGGAQASTGSLKVPSGWLVKDTRVCLRWLPTLLWGFPKFALPFLIPLARLFHQADGHACASPELPPELESLAFFTDGPLADDQCSAAEGAGWWSFWRYQGFN